MLHLETLKPEEKTTGLIEFKKKGYKHIEKDIEEIEKLGATHVNIQPDVSYDCPITRIDAICRRIETDEEFELRKKEFEAHQEQNRQRELKQLAQLKSKYGM
jgi:hypothetical protein